MSKVGSEINRLHKIFIERNPGCKGKVSLVGHSLGSLVVFDLLSHQLDANSQSTNNEPNKTQNCENLEQFLAQLNMSELKGVFDKEKIDINNIVNNLNAS